ncbi:hypothetical protein OF83DRAFT_1090673 [Amylostereum chailletii]|nr:hypothetical protein OF83DRAFT_1090673 [Amylostereum chailletii]
MSRTCVGSFLVAGFVGVASGIYIFKPLLEQSAAVSQTPNLPDNSKGPVAAGVTENRRRSGVLAGHNASVGKAEKNSSTL